MDPGSSAAATGTLYGAIALVIVTLVTTLGPILRDYLNRRWRTPSPDEPEEPAAHPSIPDGEPAVVWLKRELTRKEVDLARCRREGERYVGEVEQLRGEVEFLVEQLQEAVEERDLALAREARLRQERKRA